MQLVGRWCRREWSSPADTRNADASRRLYSSVFLGSPADAEDVAVDDDDDDDDDDNDDDDDDDDEAELKIFKNRKDTLSLKKCIYINKEKQCYENRCECHVVRRRSSAEFLEAPSLQYNHITVMICNPVSQLASQPASQPASKPTNQPSNQPTNQPASQPVN
uniref:Uncharacterized protein n=1 Tax=Glossina brevipalpis TaxID=37001 RepID=A0A1A9WU91_9MUSC